MNLKKLASMLLALGASGMITSSHAASFPSVIPLPLGWAPEGIEVGRGTTFFAGCRHGSPFTGAVYKGDLRTGSGAVFIPPDPARAVIGIKVDKRSNLLFAAGGLFGQANVFDAESGALIATYQFAGPGGTFVNDAAITRDAVYFTDSFQPVLYKIALDPAGRLANPGWFETVPLVGFPFLPGFNANGIASTPDGSTLILVSAGILYRVDSATGDTFPIDLGGEVLGGGDGLVLSGTTLYVVRNFPNFLAVVELDPSLESGVVVDQIQTPEFNLPATAAEFGSHIYLVNAFGPASPKTIIKISK